MWREVNRVTGEDVRGECDWREEVVKVTGEDVRGDCARDWWECEGGGC